MDVVINSSKQKFAFKSYEMDIYVDTLLMVSGELVMSSTLQCYKSGRQQFLKLPLLTNASNLFESI